MKILLMPQTQIVDELAVTRDVGVLQILEETTPLADHLEQAAAAVVILPVGIEVSPEVVDARREEGDLDWGAATIVRVELVLLDDVVLVDSHSASCLRESQSLQGKREARRSGRFPSRVS
jgi:hypothetical protein